MNIIMLNRLIEWLIKLIYAEAKIFGMKFQYNWINNHELLLQNYEK